MSSIFPLLYHVSFFHLNSVMLPYTFPMHTLLLEDTLPLAQTVVRYLANEDISCTLRTD